MKMLKVEKVCQDDAPQVQGDSWANQFKVSTIAAAITSLICTSVPSYAADLEIYKIPEDSVGSTTLMLMLDTSGSMTSNDYNENRLLALKNGLKDALQGTASIPRIEDKVIIGLSTFSGSKGYIRIPAKALGTTTGNQVPDGVYVKPRWQSYNRLVNKQKKRYFNACTQWDSKNYNCLLWSGETTVTPTGYSTSSPYLKNTNVGCTNGDYGDCIFIWEEPIKYRDETHRDTLLTAINNLTAGGSTPTAYAYADAAAYLMGSTTQLPQVTVNVPVYAKYNNSSGWACQSWNTNTQTCTNWGDYIDRGYSIPAGSSSNVPCTIRYNRTNYNATCYYYNSTLDDSDGVDDNSGFTASVESAKSGNLYAAPASITSQIGGSATANAKKECSGQGIYFLTDGEPNPKGGTATGTDGLSGTAYKLMRQSLSTKGSMFSCANSPLGNRSRYFNQSMNGWSCIGNYARTLLDQTKNPVGLQVKTVVVGFGSDFSGTGNDDVEDAKTWGNLGGGGWVAGSSSQDVVNSINKFIQELNKDIPSMSTGSSTVPIDTLNPEIIQPHAYFPQFEPKIRTEDSQQLWFGNVKKYYVVNNGVYSNENGGANYTVVKKSVLQDLIDIWAKSGISYPDNTPIYKKGGLLSQQILGTQTTTSNGSTTISTGRRVLTDYVFDGTKSADSQISRNFDLNPILYTYTTDAKTRTDAAPKVRGLMALLGYNISADTATNGLDLTNTTANLRQMGSVYHSLPVLLTQEGKAVATRNATTNKIQISTVGRKDYVMFGTTQGLLSVVDASSGIEKFSFVPSEMIEKQSETFKENAGNLVGGKNALYYGMDGEWAAHTVYVTKPDGTLTVSGAVRNVVGGTAEDKENLNGKQWVYGGMRMGGRSYYALDVTDIDNPTLKFHIDPSTGKVYSKANPAGKAFPVIENMAQSWSKPKLDYVNWKGKRKLVMFVGGGYDAGGDDGDGLKSNGIRTGYAGYENYNYDQTNKKGAGVYMFDANNGDLLWYADSNASTDDNTPPASDAGSSTTEAIPHLVNNDLKYSVVSEIKTVDRNNDGMVDHIYFGDLAGQAFRVDFARSSTKFITQSTKILDLHQTTTAKIGKSPRFYLPPVFTAHHSAARKEGANVVIATFVSGNKSSPLLATTDSPLATGQRDSENLQYDGVYAIYDYDIHPDGTFFPNTNTGARTLAATDATTVSTSLLKYISNSDVARSDTDTTLVKGAVADSSTGWGGWYYRFDKKFSETGIDRENANASIIKGLTPLIAMEGSLYVTMYDASNNGTSSSCGAGVKGHSFTQRLCLPTGVCGQDANYIYNLGAGIVNLNVGSVDGGNKKSIIVPDPADIGKGCIGTACQADKKFITAGGDLHFIPNRWYERYAKVE
ncbi:hypothetical protein NDN13_12800 [Acinetobacter sp. C32I]|uniref:hypothetical protein n=1 Tax=Acinetobacter sp. C32I TaxID=2950074 RepID=UPI00203758DD|nr:hypothetical protein [Acinetobacter sp. C32I]USA52353.1 hypothetical protein NDN13_12800 [Acinetobacter sp. C32I]